MTKLGKVSVETKMPKSLGTSEPANPLQRFPS
jgi:hypothetical protein